MHSKMDPLKSLLELKRGPGDSEPLSPAPKPCSVPEVLACDRDKGNGLRNKENAQFPLPGAYCLPSRWWLPNKGFCCVPHEHWCGGSVLPPATVGRDKNSASWRGKKWGRWGWGLERLQTVRARVRMPGGWHFTIKVSVG
jgi:hypothetical protein